MTAVTLPQAGAPKAWRAAQWAGLALTVLLLAALVWRPATALHLLWDLTIPLLPAVFLVNPMLWRNVCPLATLNSLTGDRVGRNALGARPTRAAWVVGILLLGVMVAARRFVFNTNGPFLSGTVLAVGALALGAGALYARRSGFCNALCPVLPVEKLYGQAPLVDVGNARCADCALCTPSACIDLAGPKSVPQTLGPARHGVAWLTTPYGIFAAAFPGFIIGYFTTDNGGLSSAVAVYAHIARYAALSYAAMGVIATVARAASQTMLLLLGASAVSVYYWLAAPALGKAYGSPNVGPPLIRIAMLALVAVWLWNATRARRKA
jgi:nitrite reductase (NADH) large subunit